MSLSAGDAGLPAAEAGLANDDDDDDGRGSAPMTGRSGLERVRVRNVCGPGGARRLGAEAERGRCRWPEQ